MGMYKYIRDIYKSPKENLGDFWKERLIKWRREPVTIRIERPTRLDRARSLGYKPKPGILLVRQRVSRGGHQRPSIRKARRPKHRRHRLVLQKSYQQIAEERTQRKYVNCEVLNSYFVCQDGFYDWYEVILVDRAHPSVIADPQLSWISEKKGRVYRGQTAAGKRSRGILTRKGLGAEKLRPSKRSEQSARANR
ncbi:MAG: 50S ribosomal protein L15e [Candidatus Woesearchaeota archaeon]